MDAHIQYFHPERMLLVDYNARSNNYLFRSDSPLTKDFSSIAADEIYSRMVELAMEQKIEFPDDFLVFDVCLLNLQKSDDRRSVEIEQEFTQDNPVVFDLWTIYGEELGPDSIRNVTERNDMIATFDKWSTDQLPELVELLYEFIHTKFDKSIVYIVHCMEGVDRTGEVIGAYEVTYKNMTFDQVVAQDTKINGGKDAPKQHNKNALKWYWEFLNYNKNC